MGELERGGVMGWNPLVGDYSKRSAHGIGERRSSLHGPWPTRETEQWRDAENGARPLQQTMSQPKERPKPVGH